MNVLILGATGMLGNVLFDYFSSKKDEFLVYGTIRQAKDKELFNDSYQDNLFFIRDKNLEISLDELLSQFNPDFVINCIGLIKQEKMASEYIQTINVNSLIPHKIKEMLNGSKCKLIHFSTDCVFSGNKGNYSESDLPDARDLYGLSKLLGEVNDENHLTIRTSIIGHELKKSLGLLEWFLSRQNDVVGFSNAIFSGLTTLEVAKMLHHYVFSNENISGLYHVASTPISKYELLKLIGKFYKTSIKIHKSAEPKINRSLDQSNFFQMTNYKAPPWEEMICDMYNWGKK